MDFIDAVAVAIGCLVLLGALTEFLGGVDLQPFQSPFHLSSLRASRRAVRGRVLLRW